MSNQSAAKRTVLEKLLEQSMVLITLDARADQVMVPSHLQGDPQLRLNLSFRFGLPIEITETGVSVTLTFGGVPSECFLPWHSIYMFVSHSTGQPFMFPADIPADVAPIAEDAAAPAAKPTLSVVAPAPTRKTAAPSVGSPDVVAAPALSPAETVASTPDEGSSPPGEAAPRRGHLRLVK